MSKNPKKWMGMKYPDSELVGLIFKFARPMSEGLFAIDAGCGSGRHLKVLEDVGYKAMGIDADPNMCRTARENGFDVLETDAQSFQPLGPISLAVCWGFMMLVDNGPEIVASWQSDIVIVDWRSIENTCLSWAGNEKISDHKFRLHNPGHILHEQEYYFHDLDQCELPGYRRVHWQQVSRLVGGENNVWYQTVHRKQ
jgi:SAM-dependent methyltransferase